MKTSSMTVHSLESAVDMLFEVLDISLGHDDSLETRQEIANIYRAINLDTEVVLWSYDTLPLTILKSKAGDSAIYKARYGEKAVEVILEEPKVKKYIDNVIADKFRNLANGIRAKVFFDTIRTAETPVEAYNLLKEYLKEDTLLSGKMRHKDVVIEYSFEYDKETETVDFSLSIDGKTKDTTGRQKPMFKLSFYLDDKNVEAVYKSVLSVMEMVK